MNEPLLLAHIGYGFGRIQGPKFRCLGSVDGCAYMSKGRLYTNLIDYMRWPNFHICVGFFFLGGGGGGGGGSKF